MDTGAELAKTVTAREVTVMRATLESVLATACVVAVLLAAGCAGSRSCPVVQVGWAVGKPLGGYGTILHTTDGGQTWVRQGSPTQIPNVDINDVSAVSPEIAWAVGEPDGAEGVILHTTDGGRNWVRQRAPATVTGVGFGGVKAISPREAWACGDDGTILHTTDGGHTWGQQNTPAIPPSDFQRLEASGPHALWVVGDQGGTSYPLVVKSTDRGAHWTRQGGPEAFGEHQIDISAVSPAVAWSVGGGTLPGKGMNVARTLDGQTWNLVTSFGWGDANGVCAVDARTVWVVTDFDGIHKTTDGGATWVKQTAPRTGFYLMGATALSAQVAWIVGISGANQGLILHTTDGGTTWTEQAMPVDVGLRRVSFVGARR